MLTSDTKRAYLASMQPANPCFVSTRRQWLAGAGALGGSLLAGLPARAQGPSGWPAVTALADRYVAERKVANVVVALGFGDAPATVIARGTDSFIRPRLSGADSLYRIYSMTKPVTGMAAMLLVGEGKLALDQPLADVLPRFRDMQVQVAYDGPITPDNLEPALRPITMRHLLTHTAGLGYGILLNGPLAEAYTERGIIPGIVSRLQMVPVFRGTPAPSLEVFADRLAEMPLVYQPGARWSYSMGLDVMGRVIEVVSGQPFDVFLKDRLFDPLGMADTMFRVPRAKADRLTDNYFAFGGLPLPIDLNSDSVYFDAGIPPFGGAGLVSTPADYDRFLEMVAGRGMFRGRRIIDEAAVLLGTSNLLPDTLSPDDPYPKANGFGAGGRVGLGEEAATYGWSGAASTVAFVDMGLGLRAGLFTQLIALGSGTLTSEFAAAVRTDLLARSGG